MKAWCGDDEKMKEQRQRRIHVSDRWRWEDWLARCGARAARWQLSSLLKSRFLEILALMWLKPEPYILLDKFFEMFDQTFLSINEYVIGVNLECVCESCSGCWISRRASHGRLWNYKSAIKMNLALHLKSSKNLTVCFLSYFSCCSSSSFVLCSPPFTLHILIMQVRLLHKQRSPFTFCVSVCVLRSLGSRFRCLIISLTCCCFTPCLPDLSSSWDSQGPFHYNYLCV